MTPHKLTPELLDMFPPNEPGGAYQAARPSRALNDRYWRKADTGPTGGEWLLWSKADIRREPIMGDGRQ